MNLWRPCHSIYFSEKNYNSIHCAKVLNEQEHIKVLWGKYIWNTNNFFFLILVLVWTLKWFVQPVLSNTNYYKPLLSNTLVTQYSHPPFNTAGFVYIKRQQHLTPSKPHNLPLPAPSFPDGEFRRGPLFHGQPLLLRRRQRRRSFVGGERLDVVHRLLHQDTTAATGGGGGEPFCWCSLNWRFWTVPFYIGVRWWLWSRSLHTAAAARRAVGGVEKVEPKGGLEEEEEGHVWWVLGGYCNISYQ